MLAIFEKQFEKLGYEKPTAIQEQVYDPMLKGDNILGLSPTGSGKTVAFMLPILAQIMPGEGTQALILAPSQELAMQTTGVIREWAKLVDANVLALTGGANVKRQMERLKKHPEIVVGTPGRVLNLLEDRKLRLHLIQTIIIDEADDMLTGETLDTVRRIAEQAPADVQLGFFSATTTQILTELPKWFGQEVKTVDVRDVDKTQGEVLHGLMQVSEKKRDDMLKRLASMPNFRALVFFNNLSTLQKTISHLVHDHVSADSLGSGGRQVQREKALRDFRAGRTRLLLTTDVAARGLDIAKLPAVINYDLPSKATTYVHRVGRTGRMGEPGTVVNFGNDHDLRDLRHLMAKTDYDMKPIYFSSRALTTEQPKTVKPKREDANPAAAVAEAQPSEQQVVAKPDAEKVTVRAERKQEVPLKKKHKKKKHDKDKGMRKKRRDQAERAK